MENQIEIEQEIYDVEIEKEPKEFVVDKLTQMFRDTEFGFDVFVAMKSGDAMKRFLFYEGRNGVEDDFKKRIQDAIVESIRELFLDENSEYAMAENIADNQNKFYIIRQDESYKPFEFLATQEEQIASFSVNERDNADAIIFRFRRDGESMWAYQYINTINIPNKKKQNFLAKMIDTESTDRFEEMTDHLFAITRKVNLLVVDNRIITKDINLLQRHFRFEMFIRASAKKAVEDIKSMQLVANDEKLMEYIQRTKSIYAKKMMRIRNYNVVSMPKGKAFSKLKSLPRWKSIFDTSNGQVNLRNYKDVENLIDFFDERYTRSDVTDDEFDTDVKQLASTIVTVAQPV